MPQTTAQPRTPRDTHTPRQLSCTTPRYAQRVSRYHAPPPPPPPHHLLPINSFARRLTIAPPLAFSLLTRSGWLACARDDISAWCFCSPVLFPQLHRQLRFIFTVAKFCIDLCSASMIVRRRARTVPLSTPNSCILLTKLQVPPPLDATYPTPTPPPPPPPQYTSQPQHFDTTGQSQRQTLKPLRACACARVCVCVCACVRACVCA